MIAAASYFSRSFCASVCMHIFFLFEISSMFLFSRFRVIWSRWMWWVVSERVCEWMFCVKRFKCKHNDKMKQFLFFGRFLSFLFHHSETKTYWLQNEENTTRRIGANSNTLPTKRSSCRSYPWTYAWLFVVIRVCLCVCALNTSLYLYNCLCSVGGTGKQSSGANLHERVRWMRKLAHHFLFCIVADQCAKTDSNMLIFYALTRTHTQNMYVFFFSYHQFSAIRPEISGHTCSLNSRPMLSIFAILMTFTDW